MNAGAVAALKKEFEALGEVTAFLSRPDLAARIACLGIARETGTVNDELARFIFDAGTGEPVARESLHASFTERQGMFGVIIESRQTKRLELRTKGFPEAVHPALSKNADGTYHSLFIFPEILARIAESQGVELVLVKTWGMNSIFGGFDPSKGYYQTNFWELQNNDALKFAALTERGRLAFMGTHDLIAHIAGVDRAAWENLRVHAAKVKAAIENYLRGARTPGIAALILPYTIGVVLDDLAQPPSYGSASHTAVLGKLLAALEESEIPADARTLLTKFPPGFQNVVNLSRMKGIEDRPRDIEAAIRNMTGEILAATLEIPA